MGDVQCEIMRRAWADFALSIHGACSRNVRPVLVYLDIIAKRETSDTHQTNTTREPAETLKCVFKYSPLRLAYAIS